MVKTEKTVEALSVTPTKPVASRPRIRKPAILQRKRKQPPPALLKSPADDKHRPIRPKVMPKPIQGIVVGGPIRIKKPMTSPGPKPPAGAQPTNGIKVGSSLQVDQLGKRYSSLLALRNFCYVIRSKDKTLL